MALTAIHPGEHLAEELEALNMSAAELARQLKVPTNRITAIINGQRTITGDAALRLAPADRYTIWSPDGSRIVFDSNRKGARNLYMKPSSGAGTEELLLESPQDNVPNDWSTAGRFILYQSQDPQTDWDLWVLPAEGDRKPWLFLKTNFNERGAQFSPDRRWVA